MSFRPDSTTASKNSSTPNSTTDPNPNPPIEEQYLPSDIEWYQRIESSLRFHLNNFSPAPYFPVPYDPHSDF